MQNVCSWISLFVLATLLAGCRSQRSDVESSRRLSDAEVRTILQEVARTGVVSDKVSQLSAQLAEATNPARGNHQELCNLLAEMIVIDEPKKNKELAKARVEIW